MIAIFATMLIALILDYAGLRNLALSCVLLCLALSLWLFLWEIYSPDYGFRMPWLQVDAQPCTANVGLA